MPEPVVVALIAIGGGVIGAALQALFARSFERSKFVRDNRRSAYQDFLAALADLSALKEDAVGIAGANSRMVESRCRIALFGSKRVVQLLAHLFANTQTFQKPLDQYRLYEVVLAMRRDSVGHDDRGIKIELFSVIFATAPEDEQ